jgi:NADPH:quinone reductase-like Zn-dependent oxidoreductase|nr:alcohol dehydrogenase catalytic domain-containing protein [Pseudomonas umsongensis]
MAQVVRFYETGGPEVLRFEEVEVGDPSPGEVRLRHVAVGLNYADTYFRNGTYPIPMPNGIGVEASGVVEALGEGVSNVVISMPPVARSRRVLINTGRRVPSHNWSRIWATAKCRNDLWKASPPGSTLRSVGMSGSSWTSSAAPSSPVRNSS